MQTTIARSRFVRHRVRNAKTRGNRAQLSNRQHVLVPIRSYQRGRDFHVLHADVVRIDLERRTVTTSAGERTLVPLSSDSISRRVRDSLERRGVIVHTNAGVERIDGEAVYAGPLRVSARTVYWAAGVAPPQLVREIDAAHAKNGALLVDEYLRVCGHANVYAIGDNAWAVDSQSGQAVPALAQAAEREADYVAGAIVAGLRGAPLEPFHFKKLGQMTLLGNYDAVAEIGLTFTGPPARLMWHAYYASRIGSWRTRIYLVTGWVMAALFGRETSEIPLNVTT